jgi:hypothetical protein
VVLPPDLDRLGDHIVAAARRAAARRERRRRFAVAGVIGALAFAALTPAALGPALRQPAIGVAAQGLEPHGCKQPQGERVTMASCEGAMVLHRPYAIN